MNTFIAQNNELKSQCTQLQCTQSHSEALFKVFGKNIAF